MSCIKFGWFIRDTHTGTTMSDVAKGLLALITAASGSAALYFLVIQPKMEEAEKAAAVFRAQLATNLVVHEQTLMDMAEDMTAGAEEQQTSEDPVTQQNIEDAFNSVGEGIQDAANEVSGLFTKMFGGLFSGSKRSRPSSSSSPNTSPMTPTAAATPPPPPKQTGAFLDISLISMNTIALRFAVGQNLPPVGMDVDLSISNLKWRVIKSTTYERGGIARVQLVGASRQDTRCRDDTIEGCPALPGTWREI